jgi:hypothetical protein
MRRTTTLRAAAGLVVAAASLAVASPVLALPNTGHGGLGGPGSIGPVGPVDPPPPPPNQPPHASIVASPALASVGRPIVLDASGSSDPDGHVAMYAFDLDGNGTYESISTSPTRTVTATTSRVYRVRVSDNLNATGTASTSVTVAQAPVARISAGSASIVAGQTQSFSAAASSTYAPATFSWDLDGDGVFETTTGATRTISRPFTSTGLHTVRVRVTDSAGGTSTASTIFTVTPAPPTTTATGTGTTTGTGDHTAPRVAIRTSSARVRRGVARVRLACPAGEATCRMAVTLTGRAKPLRGRLLGARRLTVTGGSTATVAIPLSSRARQVLAARHRLPVTVTVRATDASGNAARVARVVRLSR